jgi:transposase-like protein
MGATDGSTVGERVAVVGQLRGRQGEYGVVTALSREVGVARQTLYTWRERARGGHWSGHSRHQRWPGRRQTS